MEFEELGLSEKCLERIKLSGAENVEEYVEALEMNWGDFADYSVGIECLNEIVDRLEALGLWVSPEK